MKRLFLFEKHTCPWWLAYTWDNRIRKFFQPPDIIVKPYVRPGMTALDVGCGMGYFSLHMARYVGGSGKVISVDIQKEMLEILKKRAERRGLDRSIHPVLSQGDFGPISERVDFALNFWMLHEVDSQETMIRHMYDLLNPGGRYLIVEPKIHTGGRYFGRVIEMCRNMGFRLEGYPKVVLSRSVLWSK